jgi:hypothetical protein
MYVCTVVKDNKIINLYTTDKEDLAHFHYDNVSTQYIDEGADEVLLSSYNKGKVDIIKRYVKKNEGSQKGQRSPLLARDVMETVKKNEASQEVIDGIREINYSHFKELDKDAQVVFVNKLLLEGCSLVYIAKEIFGIDESSLRKSFNKSGYERVWQFVKK